MPVRLSLADKKSGQDCAGLLQDTTNNLGGESLTAGGNIKVCRFPGGARLGLQAVRVCCAERIGLSRVNGPVLCLAESCRAGAASANLD